jgi:hypothetical protein
MVEIYDMEARKAYNAIYEAIIEASKALGIDEEGSITIAVRTLEILQARSRR